MILILLTLLLILVINFSNKKEGFDNSLKISNERLAQNKSCYYNGQYKGIKYIQKLSDGKFYSVCEYALNDDGKCIAPCLKVDSKCDIKSNPVSLQLDLNNNNKCRTLPKQI
jgi:hypothetical protein